MTEQKQKQEVTQTDNNPLHLGIILTLKTYM